MLNSPVTKKDLGCGCKAPKSINECKLHKLPELNVSTVLITVIFTQKMVRIQQILQLLHNLASIF